MTIEQQISDLRKILRFHNEQYYVKNKPLISDEQYDGIFQKLQSLEEQNPELITPDSPTQTVSGAVTKGFKKHIHRVPMLSLKTVVDYSDDAIDSFTLSVQNLLQQSDISYVAEPKYDGLSLSLIYINGKLHIAATRGDGSVGEDVTRNARVVDNIPAVLKSPDQQQLKLVEVRGEVVMTKAVFEELNTQLRLKDEKPYSNPRNAAAGALRQLDPLITKSRRLTFLPYSLVEIAPTRRHINHIEQLAFIESMGFKIEEFIRLALDARDLKFYRYSLTKVRDELPYEIDGVVYKVNRLVYQQALGYVSREPRWAIAHKFKAPEVSTKLLAIDVQVGRTGKLTPVARLSPVELCGVTVSNVTLHNIFDLRSRGVRVGDTVFVRRAGDVIPEITAPDKSQRNGYLSNFHMPRHCPVCDSPVQRERGSKEYRCTGGYVCAAQLSAAIIHYCSKRAMNVMGLGSSTIEALVTKGRIKTIADIYKINKMMLLEIDGFGDKSISKLLQAIEESRKTTLDKFIYALGIHTVGEQTAKALALQYPDFNNLQTVSQDELMKIKDIGPVSARAIIDFINSSRYQVAKQVYNDWIIVKKISPIKKGELNGKKIVITGSFENRTRGDIEKELTLQGAYVSDTVSSATDYVLVGHSPGSKLQQATSKKIPLLTYDKLRSMYT